MTLREQVEAVIKEYDPNQERDELGRWVETGAERWHRRDRKKKPKRAYGKFQFDSKGLILTRLGGANAITQQHWGKPESNQPPVSRGYWASPFGHDDPFLYYHKYMAQMPKRLQDGSDEMKRINELDNRVRQFEDRFVFEPEKRSWREREPGEPRKWRPLTPKEDIPALTAQAEEVERYWKEREQTEKKIRKRYKLSYISIPGGFYSHIPPPHEKTPKAWYYWESAREWAKEAQRYLWSNDRGVYGKPKDGPYWTPTTGWTTERMPLPRLGQPMRTGRELFEIFVPGKD